MNSGYKPALVFSPGEILSRELEARGWTQRDLAEIVDRPYQAISEIVNGSKQITPDTARELARAFGTSIDFWINLETNYRMYLAERDEKEQLIVRRSKLYSIAPVREMLKRSWVRKTDALDELEREICEFLGISSTDEALPAMASLRHSVDRGSDAIALNAWVKRVEHVTTEQGVGHYDNEALVQAIPGILSLATDERKVSHIPARLQELGIKFVIVPHLPKTYLDGAAIISSEHPIISLTLRYDRIDSFWFTLMHEIAHLVLGHQGVYLDNTEEGHGSAAEKDESEANLCAKAYLVDEERLAEFIQQVNPRFSRTSIEVFSKQNNRHAGIVLGRLQHEGVVGYQYLRSLLVKVSPYLSEWIVR